MGVEACAICRVGASVDSSRDEEGCLVSRVNCRQCGRFTYRVDFVGFRSPDTEQLLPYLMAYVRQVSARQKGYVELGRDWPELAKLHSGRSVPMKIRNMLQWCAQHSGHGGDILAITDNDFPLFDAENPRELRFLKDSLVKKGLLEFRGSDLSQVVLTQSGWEQVAPGAGQPVPGTVFVAMSYDPTLRPAYDAGVKAALEQDCGFEVIRLDDVEHNENINEEMLVRIMASEFMVADFTQHKAGVYFEAGFARGLGRRVVWTCHESDRRNCHFDTRVFNHIFWTDAADLRARLAMRIRATIPGARLTTP